MLLEATSEPWIKALPDGTINGYRVCVPHAFRQDGVLCALTVNRFGIFNLMTPSDDGFVDTLPVDQSDAEQYADVAAVIKHRRILYGLSQDDLATRLNATGQAVWFWENGYRSPDSHSLDKLESILGEFPAGLHSQQ